MKDFFSTQVDDQTYSRNKKLSIQFTGILDSSGITDIPGVKSVDVDDNNGGSFQVAVKLDMYKVGGNWDWRADYGFYRKTKKNLLAKVVREVKKAFRNIDGCTVTGHAGPQSEYHRYKENYGDTKRVADHIGYNRNYIMVDCHWYPEEERVSIQQLLQPAR